MILLSLRGMPSRIFLCLLRRDLIPTSAFRMSVAVWIIRILQPLRPLYANFAYSFAKIYPRNEVYLLCASNAFLYSAFCSGVSALIAA